MKNILTATVFILMLAACDEPELTYVCENGDNLRGPCFYTTDAANLERQIQGVTNLIASEPFRQ